MPRKSVGLTQDNRSDHTFFWISGVFTTRSRPSDVSIDVLCPGVWSRPQNIGVEEAWESDPTAIAATYELKRCAKFGAAYWLLSPRVLRGWGTIFFCSPCSGRTAGGGILWCCFSLGRDGSSPYQLQHSCRARRATGEARGATERPDGEGSPQPTSSFAIAPIGRKSTSRLKQDLVTLGAKTWNIKESFICSRALQLSRRFSPEALASTAGPQLRQICATSGKPRRYVRSLLDSPRIRGRREAGRGGG